jgi:ABC-type nitrate/sulfonate/bicarbonate transport system permease component
MKRRFAPFAVVVAVFLSWEGIFWLFAIEQFVLPAPSAIAAAAWQ